MAKDPYHYFRIEAHELAEGLGKGVLELEKDASAENVRKLLRFAHTLKGAARVVKQLEIGELAHKIEELLAPLRADGSKVSRSAIDQALALIDEVRRKLAAIGAPATVAAPAAPETAQPAKAVFEEALQTVRLNIGELDGLIGGISESIAAVAAVQRDVSSLARAADDATDAGAPIRESARLMQSRIEQAVRELENLRGSAIEMRLVPVQVLVTELERSVRDAALSLGKRIEFSASGTDTRIDAAVLNSLRGALRHIVRNAVAHGIEEEPARIAAAKSAVGRIHLSIKRVGHRASFLCQDDGRGMDIEAIRRAAVQKGFVAASEAPGLSRERLIELLLHGGVSTSRGVSHVAGRGVGLDVVRETVAGLKGEVDIQTRPGKGTDVEVLVPVSLSLVPALRIESGGIAVYAPLDSVRRTMRLKRSEISRSIDGERVRFDGRYVPFADLGRVLRRGDRAVQSAERNAVVLEAGGRVAAIGVDQLRGVQDIIVRGIPVHVGADATVAGVALDELGVPRVVLAPAPVVHWIHQSTELPAEPQAPARQPILVIDDSLTTRMLEQSILESAGYEVDLAVCAEDALEMAGRRRYGLFIVDVEMPGMNGFEFIARTKQSAQLRDTPAVLVTSRSDPEDKRRGRDVGARAYVVKSEFNQQDILNVIRGLIG